MSFLRRSDAQQGQRGVALLIAVFSLLLISAVGVSLIVMSSTESAVTWNYKRSTAVFYAAQAGLEEARERLVVGTPDTIRGNPSFPNELLPVAGQMLYIVNPAPGDPAFSPQFGPALYFDAEYGKEFGVPLLPNPAQIVQASAMTQAGNLPPLDYKWVRITLKTEAMGGLDLNGDGVLDSIQAVRAQSTDNQCLPGMPRCTSDPNAPVTTRPVYRLTALALDPYGSKRMVQAEVAEMPVINPIGAIASQAGVTINGQFNSFGSWPPIVMATCGVGNAKTTIPTCGNYTGGKLVGDCTKPYDPATNTCGGVPRSSNDYCNAAPAVDGVASAGAINAGAGYSEVPDLGLSCDTTGPGCISTVSPHQATDPNIASWPYDMGQIMDLMKPPTTEPIFPNVKGVSCGVFDSNGNRTCSGQDVQIGTLPSTWPPPPNVQQLDNQPRYVYADVGPGGLLKLTGASKGSGILVVNGDLAIEAGFQWYGLVMVHGTVTFLGGGSTPTNVYGGVLAGKDINSANTNIGGSVSIVYSSCAYRYFSPNQPLRYLSFREIPQ